MSAISTPAFTSTDVSILEKKAVYQGYFRIDKYIVKHRLFRGGWTKPFAREVFERGHAAAALLYDPDLNKIVLTEQFRIGVVGQTSHPWLFELVAGIMDPGETAEQVAIRETQEEAGLQIKAIIPIYEYWVSPGGTSEKVALFCARVDASQANGIHGLEEEGEDIKVHSFDVAEVYQLLAQGRICNAPTIIALQWLQLHEKEVRGKWLA